VNRYVLSPEADQDLTDIWDYIAATDRWIEKLFDAFAPMVEYQNGRSQDTLAA
jgi:plasmid stabilization system protein ParE